MTTVILQFPWCQPRKSISSPHLHVTRERLMCDFSCEKNRYKVNDRWKTKTKGVNDVRRGPGSNTAEVTGWSRCLHLAPPRLQGIICPEKEKLQLFTSSCTLETGRSREHFVAHQRQRTSNLGKPFVKFRFPSKPLSSYKDRVHSFFVCTLFVKHVISTFNKTVVRT